MFCFILKIIVLKIKLATSEIIDLKIYNFRNLKVPPIYFFL